MLLLITPRCSTFFPVIVTFARGASMRPEFVAVPLVESTVPTYTSSPRTLASLDGCGAKPNCCPLAMIVCPSGVEIVPAFVTFGPISATRPPV